MMPATIGAASVQQGPDYVKGQGLSGLTALFGNSAGKAHESEKLLHLYWNRAELKKEFARLRKEQYKLQDRIKQQEGVSARLLQKLEHLEDLLLDPDCAGNVLVFYQLRGLALRCQRKLAKFAEQLKQQREHREHNGLLLRWNDERRRESQAVERRLAGARARIVELEAELQAEKDRLIGMRGLLKFFRRRSVTASLEKLAAQLEALRLEEQAGLQQQDEIRTRKPPENQGLDLPTKRSINFMILAYAQQLLLHFGDDDLAALAKEASEKSAGAISYGSRQECEQLLARIRKRVDAIEQNTDFASILQQRARLIGERAMFRNDGDVVPIAGTVTTVYDIDSRGSVIKTETNLLGENYWGIAKVLSR
jgi:hypothetical protein